MAKSKLPGRKIHVELPQEVHQKLRVRAAIENISMQTLVARTVANAVKDVPLPKLKKSS